MAVDINELMARYNEYQRDKDFKERTRKENVRATMQSLSRITPEEIKEVQQFVPAISQIVTFTEQDILENKNGEAQLIQDVYNQLVALADSLLKQYEERL